GAGGSLAPAPLPVAPVALREDIPPPPPVVDRGRGAWLATYAASNPRPVCTQSGSRAGARGSGEDRRPRGSRIGRTTTGSTRVASTRIRREHFGHRSTSNPQVRFINKAQSTYLARAKSAPSSSCPQRATLIMVGSTKTTGSRAAVHGASAAAGTAGVAERGG